MSTYFISNRNSCLPLCILLDPNFFYKSVSLQNHKPTAPKIGSIRLMREGVMLTRIVNDAQLTIREYNNILDRKNRVINYIDISNLRGHQIPSISETQDEELE